MVGRRPLFQVLLRVCFLWGFPRVLSWSFGAPMIYFGPLLRSFGIHFGISLWIRWIPENSCFTIAKHYFLRSGRVPSRVFFLFFFRPIISSSFVFKFCGFVESQGPHSAANGSLWASLRGQTWSKLLILIACRFQGGSQVPERSHLGSLRGVLWLPW